MSEVQKLSSRRITLRAWLLGGECDWRDTVVGANVLFRPRARKIDRQPSRCTDVETKYVLRFVCRKDDEAKLRVLLMHHIHALPITLHALYSEDLNSSGKVEVRATLVSAGRQNAMLEEIVQRLGLESGVSAVSWELAAQEPE
jgi:putative Mg2+ transporter-C (MgtC) family protein